MVISEVNVNMGDKEVNAKIAEEVVFVNMEEKDIDAKIAEEVVFVHTVGYDVIAKIAEEEVFVNMGEIKVFAKTAEEVVFVNMEGYDIHAKIAEEVVFVNIGDKEVNAKSAFITIHAMYVSQSHFFRIYTKREQIISYNRNKNILRESNLLEDIEIRSDLVLLGTKFRKRRSDILQVVKLNRSKIIYELMDFLHGKRKGGEGGMSPKRIECH